ncbi:GNAT family N-acetyltransferase [Luteipulveratus halotolerans]|uniref:GNAT family N-acetyltransferase n=1 Tax=Luteipulveratus halotolerans TaxID=1631356 RepID=UPI00067FA216|nr:GNAT family N-acetyltransferase [Luteipulveratus halotolerans]
MTSEQPVPDSAVRTARVADAAAVGAVQSAAWRAAYADVLPSEVLDTFDAAAFAQVWARSLSDPPSPQHRLLVATSADDVVGLAAIGPTGTEGRGELLVLGVHPDARRTGHGSRLLNAAADTLRANDFREVEAWIPARDEAARAFLEASGLRPDGAWREREVSDDGSTVREVRLTALLHDT